jgi:hypothetical protein
VLLIPPDSCLRPLTSESLSGIALLPMKSRFLFLILLGLPAIHIPSIAQSSTETAAQRQLREDRERFSREIERQASEARIREERARAVASEQRTAEELERLRIQQSKQTQNVESLRQRERLREAAPLPTSSSIGVTTDLTPRVIQPANNIVPDVSITFLADGNCVIYLKDRPPEVRTPTDAEKILSDLLRARSASSTSPKK